MYSKTQGQYGSPAKQARRNSPIHHQKSPSYAHRYQDQSPSQITTKKEGVTLGLAQSQSPERLQESDVLKHKINQLETQLVQTKTDLELSRFQNNRSNVRVDSSQLDQLFSQNQALLSENEDLQKGFSQKRTEVDIWKNKYEAQMNTLIQLKANYETDIQKIQKDNEILKSQINGLSKNLDLENRQLKQTLFEEGKERIDFIKTTHAKNTQLYEEQLRKMKDIIEDREKEVHEITTRLSNSRSSAESEIRRINDDRDKLRDKVAQLELALQKELDGQKQKLELVAEQQKHSLRQLHNNELEVLQTEADKIKDLLDIKNEEIQALINQNRQQKLNFEQDNQELKEEIQNLQDKIYEINREKEEEINDLKEKLATLHITDIQEMKLRNDSLTEKLTNENKVLKDLIDQKSEELDNQIREKLLQRESYNQELDRLKDQINRQRQQQVQFEEENRQDALKNDVNLKQIQKDHDTHTQQLNDQINFLEKELDGLKELIVKKNNETDIQLARSTTVKNNQDEDIRLLRKENDEWKRAFENLEYEKEKIIEEFKNRIADLDGQHTDLKRKLEQKNDYLESELNQASENLRYGSEEKNNMDSQKRQLEGEIRRLNREIDQLRDQSIAQDKQKALEMEDLRRKLQNSNSATVSTIKGSHANQQRLYEEENDNLKRIIDSKDREIQDMIQKYETLEVAFNEFQQNADKLDDYEKKLQLLGSEIVSTKNLYDVFVKTKSRFSSGKKISPQ